LKSSVVAVFRYVLKYLSRRNGYGMPSPYPLVATDGSSSSSESITKNFSKCFLFLTAQGVADDEGSSVFFLRSCKFD